MKIKQPNGTAFLKGGPFNGQKHPFSFLCNGVILEFPDGHGARYNSTDELNAEGSVICEYEEPRPKTEATQKVNPWEENRDRLVRMRFYLYLEVVAHIGRLDAINESHIVAENLDIAASMLEHFLPGRRTVNDKYGIDLKKEFRGLYEIALQHRFYGVALRLFESIETLELNK